MQNRNNNFNTKIIRLSDSFVLSHLNYWMALDRFITIAAILSFSINCTQAIL